jgi:hypothetical protein
MNLNGEINLKEPMYMPLKSSLVLGKGKFLSHVEVMKKIKKMRK